MAHDLDIWRSWTGGLEDLLAAGERLLGALSARDDALNVRLLRDYIARGLLGPAGRDGRELVFTYDNLLRLAATRLLLRDGWSLAKIGEYLGMSSPDEIEGLLPTTRNPALDALATMRPGAHPETDGVESGFRRLKRLSATDPARRAAQASALQAELPLAMHRLGQPGDAPRTESLTAVDLAPWIRVLIQTSHVSSLTLDEAEDAGRALTATLTRLLLKKGSNQ